MVRSGISIIIALFFLASCSGCLNQNKPENAAEEANKPLMSGDTSDLETSGEMLTSTNNDSAIRLEPGGKVKIPFGNQKLDNSPEIRNTVEYHYKRGLVLFQISKYEEGIKEFDTVISMDPKMGKAYINRGTAWMELKNYPEAARDFQKAINLNNSDSLAYINLGLAYLYQGNFTGAIEANTKLINITPTDPKAFFNRGFAYGQIKDFKNAISDFDQAIRINPSYHEAYFNRGLAYFFSGDKTKACSDWELAKQYGSAKATTAIEKECK
jgi:tetratricopeptide (TPR) repeat protein